MPGRKPAKAESDVIRLSDEAAVKEAVWSSVLGLWDVVNTLTRLRPSRRERYRVSIFGSARAARGTFAYEETKRAAKALAEMGCDMSIPSRHPTSRSERTEAKKPQPEGSVTRRRRG